MADANPVPDAGHLHPDPADAERLFSSIERRRDEMIDTQARPTSTPPPLAPWYRRPAVVFLIAVAGILVVAIPLMIFSGGGSDLAETPATTAPVPEVTTTVPATPVPATPTTLQTSPTTIKPETTLPGPGVQGGGYLWKPAGFATGQFTDATEIYGVVHTGSVFSAAGSIGDCGQVWVSPDGARWNGAPNAGGSVGPPCRLALTDLASNGATSVAVGTHGTMESDGYEDEATVMVSDNGFDWSHPRGGDWTPFGLGEVITSVAASDSVFVAAGSDFWFSLDPLDGRAWSEATAPPVEVIVDVTAGLDGFFAVGYLPGTVAAFDWSSANAVLHSPDGRTWSIVAELEGDFKPGDECWVAGNAITHGPHGYVIVGDCVPEETNIAYSSMWTSEDGLSWSQVPHDEAAFGESAYIQTIAADESGYVAAGWSLNEESHATVWFSDDGNSWTRTELSGQGNSGILGVAVHEGTAVAVGHNQFQPAIWWGTRPYPAAGPATSK
jgi:hypothetical protein